MGAIPYDFSHFKRKSNSDFGPEAHERVPLT